MNRNLLATNDKTKKNRDTASTYEKSKTSVVLMEIIISIFLFMIVSSVCIQLFVQSYKINETSTDLQNSSVIASEVADLLILNDGDIFEVSEMFENAVVSGNTMEIYYDDSFAICNKDDSLYTLTINGDGEKLQTFNIDMLKDGQSVYNISVKVTSYAK